MRENNVEYKIFDSGIQVLKVTLGEGEAIYADTGHMIAKSSSVQMKTRMVGGLFSSLKRKMTGATFFVTELVGPGTVYLSNIFPGKIAHIPVQGKGILAISHSFLATEKGVKYDTKLTKLTVGKFGGEGYFLAKFHGSGNLFLHGYGDVITEELKEGEEMQIEATHLMAFEEGMKYGIKFVGGITSMLFAHEGLFFINIKGPGRVWIQSLNSSFLTSVFMKYLNGK